MAVNGYLNTNYANPYRMTGVPSRLPSPQPPEDTAQAPNDHDTSYFPNTQRMSNMSTMTRRQRSKRRVSRMHPDAFPLTQQRSLLGDPSSTIDPREFGGSEIDHDGRDIRNTSFEAFNTVYQDEQYARAQEASQWNDVDLNQPYAQLSNPPTIQIGRSIIPLGTCYKSAFDDVPQTPVLEVRPEPQYPPQTQPEVKEERGKKPTRRQILIKWFLLTFICVFVFAYVAITLGMVCLALNWKGKNEKIEGCLCWIGLTRGEGLTMGATGSKRQEVGILGGAGGGRQEIGILGG